MMRYAYICLLLSIIMIVSSCSVDHVSESNAETVPNSSSETVERSEEKQETEERIAYVNITAEQAKHLMDTESNYVILDVRTQEEYNESHIKGAILIPDYEIAERAEAILADKDQLILVYCRSGRRSKLASEQLVALGYTNIREFGGIIDWPYEVE